MTIEDMIEGGIEFQGHVSVQVWDGSDSTFPFEGEGDQLGIYYCDEPWYSEHPVTFIWNMPHRDDVVIEVDGERE